MKPFYSLGMFPYPSGVAHLGHVRVYTLSDVAARHARQHGRPVLHPIGWDAFGLPAENAAKIRGVHPRAFTEDCIAAMRRTFRRMDWSFDWDREFSTADPTYYRWTQWLFHQLWRAGLAVRARGWVQWCPDCATVLADEQVVAGGLLALWGGRGATGAAAVDPADHRLCGSAVVRSGSADGLGPLPSAVAVQRHWIRRSEGSRVRFGDLEVFTTRVDTLYGAVAVVVAPEHPWAQAATDPAVVAAVPRDGPRWRPARCSGRRRRRGRGCPWGGPCPTR